MLYLRIYELTLSILWKFSLFFRIIMVLYLELYLKGGRVTKSQAELHKRWLIEGNESKG